MDDRYLIIGKPSIAETKVKGSRFIARTSVATSVQDAISQLDKIRKQEHAATHNCFAYVVGVPGDESVFKYSDDGEPNGTAGRPIYDIISGSGLTNVLVVVTRYFGGIKLGTGGLARAYGEAAKIALDKSGVTERFVTASFKVTVDFSIYDSLLKAIHRLGAHQVKADFSEQVILELEIRRSKSELLVAEITELSKGKARIEQI
jgi:uncharacterized YigZ family protein